MEPSPRPVVAADDCAERSKKVMSCFDRSVCLLVVDAAAVGGEPVEFSLNVTITGQCS